MRRASTYGRCKGFHQARRIARCLGLSSARQWRDYSRSSQRPLDMPSHPDRQYRACGWVSWADWLGTKNKAGGVRRRAAHGGLAQGPEAAMGTAGPTPGRPEAGRERVRGTSHARRDGLQARWRPGRGRFDRPRIAAEVLFRAPARGPCLAPLAPSPARVKGSDVPFNGAEAPVNASPQGAQQILAARACASLLGPLALAAGGTARPSRRLTTLMLRCRSLSYGVARGNERRGLVPGWALFATLVMVSVQTGGG